MTKIKKKVAGNGSILTEIRPPAKYIFCSNSFIILPKLNFRKLKIRFATQINYLQISQTGDGC